MHRANELHPWSREASKLRDPQCSKTAYVQCVFEALNYMLSERGVPVEQTGQVEMAVCAQLIYMIQNDLNYIHLDSSSQKVCKLALSQL